jgi:RHS Repeat
MIERCTYAYDGVGHVTRVTDGVGRATSSGYDMAGRSLFLELLTTPGVDTALDLRPPQEGMLGSSH